MSGYVAITSFRISEAGGPITDYAELSRKHYRWRWLARLSEGRSGWFRIEPGQIAFWRTEIVPASHSMENSRDR